MIYQQHVWERFPLWFRRWRCRRWGEHLTLPFGDGWYCVRCDWLQVHAPH